MNLSIRWKVALGTLAAVILGLAVAGWLTIRSVEESELQRVADMLDTRGSLIAHALRSFFTEAGLPSVDSPSLQAAVGELSEKSHIRVTVVAPDGTVLADSSVTAAELLRLENHRSRPEILHAQESGRGADIRASQTTGERTFYVALAMGQPPPEAAASWPVVRVGFPLTTMEDHIRTVQQDLAVAFGIAFLAALALSIILARSITGPLAEMTSVARQLAGGTPGVRIHIASRDEVGFLAKTLNHMTDELEAKIKEVSEDRAQLLAMLTAMIEGIMVLDYRGVILQVNPAFERMFGLGRGDWRGRPYGEVIRHESLSELASRVLKTRTGEGHEIILFPSGRCLRVEASMAGGRLENEACVVLVFHDITELRRLEKIRKDFVANVSHELRTPLTSIKGYVEALIDGGKDDPDTSGQFLDIILRQSNRLNLILDDLLQLSQIESGQVLFRKDPVDLRSVLERTVAFIKPLADKKQHTVAVTLPDQVPPVVGDEDRLVQVFINLLENAVKYTPDGGAITVELRWPSNHRKSNLTDAAEVLVSDSGIGIPETDRPRVFERFYRVDKARSRELGGTGLGLAIVKHIVEGHGGLVWVEGNDLRGSRFIVRLPVTRSA
ncbi:MAG TPA: ATP-binding protein [Nitrospiraceae bacterium]|nr:ATP-binding protein [Nitrospiraceae bacterium]